MQAPICMHSKGLGCVLQIRSHRPSHIWFTASSLNRYLSLFDSYPLLATNDQNRGYRLHVAVMRKTMHIGLVCVAFLRKYMHVAQSCCHKNYVVFVT